MSKRVLYAGSVAVDNVVTTVWMVATLALPRLLGPLWQRGVSETRPRAALITGIEEDSETLHPTDVGLVLALSLAAVYLSDRVAAALRVDVSTLFAPLSPALNLDSSALDSAVRSAVARVAHDDRSASAGSSRAVLIDPEELREIGLAIGRAIVEATRHIATGGPLTSGRIKSADTGRRPQAK